MADAFNLDRFVDAQNGMFEAALAELAAGRKQSHWMWFIFPQLAGLGRSATAQSYGIRSIDEARAYLAHPLLGDRLRRCVNALISWAAQRNAEEILGPIDAVKLRSSLTLFDAVEASSTFRQAIDALFGGEADERTLALLRSAR